MKKLSQQGFTLIEGLLIVIALSLVVGVGYYVKRANTGTKKTESVAQSTTQKTDAKAVPQKDYLMISELGIKFDKTAIPTVHYKMSPSEAKRSYPNVPELQIIQLYDTAFDNLKNSQGQTCESLGSSIVAVQVISIADRDKNYATYKNSEIGPNDDVPTVVSDKYAKKVGDYLYDYYKTQGVQAQISCVNDSATVQDKQAQTQFNDSYNKLKEMITTAEKS